MNFILHIITTICLLLPSAISYNLLFGKGKILHFGQIAFSIIAAYTMWVLVMRYGWTMPTAFAVSLVTISIMAILFTWLSLSLEPDGLGVMSIAVHLMVLAIILNWNSVTRGALGIPGVPRLMNLQSPLAFAFFAAGVAALWLLVIWGFDRGRFGRALTALAEHEWHAESLGIRRSLIHFLAFMLAGVGAMLTNIMFHSYLQLLNPSDFGFPAMIFYVMVVVAGKPGSLKGCVISLIALTFLKESIRFIHLPAAILGPVRLILFGLILFAAVWWRRDTLFPKQRTV